MARPESVKIAGRHWDIKYPDLSDENLCGDCSETHGHIRISTHMVPWEERDTMLHELMHATLRSQGRPYDEVPEELYVRALATGLLGVLREHPEIVKYLFTEKLK